MEYELRNLDIWVWRYLDGDRNYSGLHFTARPDSCRVLIDLLARLEAIPGYGHRTIPLRQLHPDDEAKVSGGKPYVSFSHLRLALQPQSTAIRFMSAHFGGTKAVLEITPEFLPQLREGIEGVSKGKGDWCITPDGEDTPEMLGERDRKSLDFWFWPCFGHLFPIP